MNKKLEKHKGWQDYLKSREITDEQLYNTDFYWQCKADYVTHLEEENTKLHNRISGLISEEIKDKSEIQDLNQQLSNMVDT